MPQPINPQAVRFSPKKTASLIERINQDPEFEVIGSWIYRAEDVRWDAEKEIAIYTARPVAFLKKGNFAPLDESPPNDLAAYDYLKRSYLS